MLKIIHIDTGVDLRGGQRQLLMLARGLRFRGHEQLIVSLENSGLAERALQEGFRVFTLPSHDPAHTHGILQLRRYLQTETFQMIHAHDGKGQTIGWLASVGMRMSRVAHRRVTFLPSRKIDSRLKYGHTCDAVISVSNFIRRLLVESGVPESRIEVIPDGVEIPEEMPDSATRTRIRGEWKLDAQQFVAGHLGALTHEKGQDIAIEAAKLLSSQMPAARIILGITGSPRPADTCPPNMQWIAAKENLEEFFAGLDLYIMPSRAEGLGSSVLLAMAYGLAVVATRVGGLPEIIDDGEAGWLIPPGEPVALAKAIENAAADLPRLRGMGIKARARSREFSSNIMVERTEALYKKVLK